MCAAGDLAPALAMHLEVALQALIALWGYISGMIDEDAGVTDLLAKQTPLHHEPADVARRLWLPVCGKKLMSIEVAS